jgi:hypothetical protein
MKYLCVLDVKKTEGANQDEEAIKQALEDAIDGIGSVFAQDDQHEDESEYEVSVETLARLVKEAKR